MAERILEYVQAQPTRIDRAAGRIHGVKLLGEESRNPAPHNNSYPFATRKKAIPLFESARVYIGHPPRSEAGECRRYEDGMGMIRSVEEKGDGLYGTWCFPPKHPLAESVLWDAEHNPAGLGFSVNGTAGKIRMENGRKIIESFETLHSLDLVTRPATNRSLFESRRSDPPRRPSAPLPAGPLTGIHRVRLEAVDRLIDGGMYSRRLRESICKASEQEIDRLLENLGVGVPSYVRDAKSLARWITS
jgi:hypothetical protein